MAMARFRRPALALFIPVALGMAALLTACGGDTGPSGQRGATGLAGANGMTALVQVLAEAPGASCSAGGSKIVAGLDANADGVLQSTEITSTQYVCNAAPGLVGAAGATGTAGSDGLSPLGAIRGEPAGANCANGGKRLDAGKDANADGVLQSSEVTSTSYVCNGATGATGAAGAAGANGAAGLNSLISLTTEPAGANCTYGGSKAASGLDINANGVLDAGEVTNTTYLCNGAPGATGATGATGAAGAPGAPGAAGATGATG